MSDLSILSSAPAFVTWPAVSSHIVHGTCQCQMWVGSPNHTETTNLRADVNYGAESVVFKANGITELNMIS